MTSLKSKARVSNLGNVKTCGLQLPVSAPNFLKNVSVWPPLWTFLVGSCPNWSINPINMVVHLTQSDSGWWRAKTPRSFSLELPSPSKFDRVQLFPESMNVTCQGNECKFTTSFIEEGSLSLPWVKLWVDLPRRHCKPPDCLINLYMPRKKNIIKMLINFSVSVLGNHSSIQQCAFTVNLDRCRDVQTKKCKSNSPWHHKRHSLRLNKSWHWNWPPCEINTLKKIRTSIILAIMDIKYLKRGIHFEIFIMTLLWTINWL